MTYVKWGDQIDNSSSNREFCILQISTLVDKSSALISLGSCSWKRTTFISRGEKCGVWKGQNWLPTKVALVFLFGQASSLSSYCHISATDVNFNVVVVII